MVDQLLPTRNLLRGRFSTVHWPLGIRDCASSSVTFPAPRPRRLRHPGFGGLRQLRRCPHIKLPTPRPAAHATPGPNSLGRLRRRPARQAFRAVASAARMLTFPCPRPRRCHRPPGVHQTAFRSPPGGGEKDILYKNIHRQYLIYKGLVVV